VSAIVPKPNAAPNITKLKFFIVVSFLSSIATLADFLSAGGSMKKTAGSFESGAHEIVLGNIRHYLFVTEQKLVAGVRRGSLHYLLRALSRRRE
jgi:hypothetical protein